MRVRVKVFATLRHYVPDQKPGSPIEVELPNETTLADLVKQLNLPQEGVKVIFVNARAQPLSYVLQPDDEVGIFPPVGGG